MCRDCQRLSRTSSQSNDSEQQTIEITRPQTLSLRSCVRFFVNSFFARSTNKTMVHEKIEESVIVFQTLLLFAWSV